MVFFERDYGRFSSFLANKALIPNLREDSYCFFGAHEDRREPESRTVPFPLLQTRASWVTVTHGFFACVSPRSLWHPDVKPTVLVSVRGWGSTERPGSSLGFSSLRPMAPPGGGCSGLCGQRSWPSSWGAALPTPQNPALFLQEINRWKLHQRLQFHPFFVFFKNHFLLHAIFLD